MNQSMNPNVNQIDLLERFSELIALNRRMFAQYHLIDESSKRSFRHQLYQRHGDFGKSLMNLAVVYEETEKKVSVSYESKVRKRAHELGVDGSGDLAEVEKRIQQEMIRRTDHAGSESS